MAGPDRIFLKRKENIEKKINRAKTDGDIKSESEFRKELGNLYYEEKQYEKALNAYKKQLTLCEILEQKLECAIAHRMIGEINGELGNFEDALKHQNLYLDISKNLGNLIEKQRAYATLGRTYLLIAESFSNGIKEKKQKDEALNNSKNNFTKSIKVCEKLDKKIEDRELQMMRARLLLNLGLVLEHQKDLDQAHRYMEQSRTLCEKNKLDEDLFRTSVALSGYYERLGNIEMASKNLDDAAKVKDLNLKSEAEISKAELFLKLGKWLEAKKILRKLFKNDKLLEPVKEQVITLLRIVIVICQNEDELILKDDLSEKLKLYEILGDAAVAVKAWDKAIDFYSNMLSCAEKTKSDQLTAALSSLYQTLRDAGKVEEAIKYARRELDLCSNPKDACNTALYLTNLLIEACCPHKEVREMFNQAWDLAKESKDFGLEKIVIKDFIEFLENSEDLNEKLISSLNERLNDLPNTQSSTEFETEPETVTTKIGEDINLDDLSDESEDEFREPKRRKLVVKKKHKLNEKGETPLHVACIEGDISAVEKLLEEKHPVAVRDNAGWTPLHEVANYGFLEIVKLLIQAGANVNDPGGKDCCGITPAHDAARNGHISIVHLLLDNGADPNLLTTEKENVLHCLEDWRNRVDSLNEKELKEYKILKKRLQGMIKFMPIINKKRNDDKLQWISDEEDDNIVTGNTLDDWTRPEKISAGEYYKQTMKSLKHPNRVIQPSNQVAPSKITAPLIDAEEILVDSWLDDDIGKQRTKPYFNGVPTFSSEPTIKRKSKDSDPELEKECEKERKRLKRQKIHISPLKQAVSPVLDENSYDSVSSSDTILGNLDLEKKEENSEIWPARRKKNPKQTNLLKQGFSKVISSRSPSPIKIDLECSNYAAPQSIQKRNSWEAMSQNKDLIIKIEDEIFELTLHAKDFSKTISNIEELIRHKFESRTGCRPRFKFKTEDEVLLSEEILLEEIFEGKNRLTLSGHITENDLSNIVGRYSKVCENFNIDPSELMLKSLRSSELTSQPTFRLNPDCDQKELEPLIKCLRYQITIKILDVSHANFYGRGELLNHLLKGLINLSELYLQNCDIDDECLSHIEKLPTEIKILDLAYNPLSMGGEGHKKIYKLLEPLKKLQKLNLRSCHLKSFESRYVNSSLVELDISWNPMDGLAAANLLQEQLLNLNLSNTLNPTSANMNVIDKIFYSLPTESQGFSLNNLESLDLTACQATDLDVDKILSQTPNLTRINLSCNINVTKTSLCAILKRKPSMTYVNLNGCRLIEGFPDENLKIVSPQFCTLYVDMNPDVIDAWERLWLGRVRVKKLPMKLVSFEPI